MITAKAMHLLRFLFTLLISLPVIVSAEVSDPRLVQRIAFGSCANQSKAQPIWDVVVAQKPNLFVFLGDNIYADTTDMALMKEKYARLAGKPGYQELKKLCPVIATWDDHDYGENDSGSWYSKKAESQKIMLDFFEVPANSPRRHREGVYESFVYGPQGRRLQILLLDTRYFKSRQKKDPRSDKEKKAKNLVGWYVPNDDPAATMLGEVQWKWLEQQLKQPADLRIIGSSTQVVADERGMESWGNFPLEQKRLFDLISSTGAQHAIFISGDVHFSEISRTKDGPYPLYDFTSSGLTNSNSSWAAAVNTRRVSKIACTEPNAGFVDIDWSGRVVTLRTLNVKGKTAIERKIPFSELEINTASANGRSSGRKSTKQ